MQQNFQRTNHKTVYFDGGGLIRRYLWFQIFDEFFFYFVYFLRSNTIFELSFKRYRNIFSLKKRNPSEFEEINKNHTWDTNFLLFVGKLFFFLIFIQLESNGTLSWIFFR